VALQANKATFFFQLVSFQQPDQKRKMLTEQQERELEKVNAFYLQKEAEVCSYLFLFRCKVLVVN